MQDDEQRLYERARKRAQELRSFYSTMVIYVLVNALLFVIDILTGDGLWFYWPLLGWGIGMAIWAFSLFGLGGHLGSDWEERKTRELMERERQRQGR